MCIVGTRDEGQWPPNVEPIWITATKQVENLFSIKIENFILFRM